jgi:CrcB protein
LLVFIALGGAVGAVARYGIGGWIHGLVGSSFPWGTFAVNLVGSFALGFAIRTLHASTVASEFRGFLTIGLFGAFTTFSTFSYEAVTLLQDGEWERASAYLFGSVAAGVAAVIAGLWLASVTLHVRA